MNAGIIILAAGASTRMGQSKQMLAWNDQTLLNHAIDSARATGAPVVVVLGANEEVHRTSIQNRKITMVSNPRWETGMGSSLKVGLQRLMRDQPGVEAMIAMVCDQPYVTTTHLLALWKEYLRSKTSVFSKYADTLGVPALFGSDLFGDILTLDDDQGAKKLIQKLKPGEFVSIELRNGEKDLDTYQDYLDLRP
jgi:molybdenum cofactor cytidylyltransferase